MATNTDTIVDIECDASTALSQGRHVHGSNADVAESYLQELYRTECEFRISHDKVDLIQKYVESSVQTLIQRVVVSLNITDAYTETRILNVGSFYDGTKNAKPDEFDFIYVLKESNSSSDEREKQQLMKLSNEFHKRLEDIVKNNDLPGLSCEYIRLHGPASKLELHIPTNVNNEELDRVSIDISPAYRCLLQNNFRLDQKIRFRDWVQIIGNTGSFLKMQIYQNHPERRTFVVSTVTESEKHYMLTIMSEKHKKVYRLLKLLINGNDGNDQVRHLVRQLPEINTRVSRILQHVPIDFDPKLVFDFPSYVIKCLVFLHEQCCENNTSRVSDCMLQVLGQLLKRFQTELDYVSESCFSFCYYYDKLSIRVEKVFGGSVKVADDFVVATDFAVKVSDMINRLRTGTEIEHESIEPIMLPSRTVGRVKNVLQHKVPSTFRNIVFLCFVTLLYGGVVVSISLNVGESETVIEQQTNYTEAPHSNLTYFDIGQHYIECISSKETNSCSLHCKTYYCFPEYLYSDLEEIKNRFTLSCDTNSTSIASFNDSRNVCNVFMCTPRFTANSVEVNVSMEEEEGFPVPLSVFRANYKDYKIDCCCLMLTVRIMSSRFIKRPALIVLCLTGIILFAILLWCITQKKYRWKQMQRYKEVRRKIVATLHALEENGITLDYHIK